jgi:hypothetical protein
MLRGLASCEPPRQPPLDFGPQHAFHVPAADSPTPRRRRRFIDRLLNPGVESFNPRVIDSVMTFLPAAQNNPVA